MNTRRNPELTRTAHEQTRADSEPSRPHLRGIVDLSDVLAEVFATMDEHTSAENARRLSHALLTGELPRDFEWRRAG